MRRALVIGGSGLIGMALTSALLQHGPVLSTSRNRGEEDRVLVDLTSGEFRDAFRAGATEVYFCAAMTNIQSCENNPVEAHRVNVAYTLALITGLVERGAFVVWLSSNTVFDGQLAGMDEASAYSPTTCYGRQKMETEQAILGSARLAAQVAIVRLSKVLSPTQGIAADFMQRLQAGESIDAFSDLYLSPASLAYVCTGLQQIARARLPGVFHLSGEAELSYAQFAQLLAARAGVARNRVRPVESASRTDVAVLYRPLHPALRMTRTTQLLGLQPESIESTLNGLFPLGRQQ